MNTPLFRLVVAIVGGALSSLGAQAQDWARAKLNDSPRHQEWVAVKYGDRTVQCFVVYPEVKDRAPVVLLIHEIFGLSDWAMDEADQVAAAGYIAIEPDLLSGLGPKGGGTSEFPDRSAVTKAVSGLPADQVTADLDAAANYALKDPAASGQLMVAGFCWGGGKSFLWATHRKDLKAAFVFYGVAPKNLGEVHCPVYGFYGGNDARISATVPATQESMKKAGKAYEAVVYDGAGHGFMRAGEDPAGTVLNKAAHDQGWARWIELMRSVSADGTGGK